MRYDTDELRWEAVRSRDHQADGAFFFGVITTGIYCRPGCVSRTPRREHIRFYVNTSEAEQAGLRPCKRCTPAAADAPNHSGAIAQACALIDSAETAPGLGELAAAVGLSPFYFQRLFKHHVGVTPKQYAMARWRQRLADRLQTAQTVTTGLLDAGFASTGQFYETDAAVMGLTPNDMRQGAAGRTIKYGSAHTSLGWVTVGATERGICVIELGDLQETTKQRVRERFPNASFVADHQALTDVLNQVVNMLDTPAQGVNLPLDIQGTAFQQRVWQALRQIPAGETRSYAQLAAALGSPNAARAVAGACAANKLAVVIPCHRIVREDGGLGGYRWGIERKRALLERER